MPTKVELEAELAALKKELEDLRAAREEPSGEGSDTADDAANDSRIAQVLSHLDGTDLDRLFKEFVKELEDVRENKPLLSLFGAFVLGYVLGRAR